MSKKKILVPGYKSQDGFFGAGSNHLEYLSQFGDVKILMPFEKLVEGDMLYLPGGMDLNPTSYEEVPGFKTSNQDVFKQFFFDKRLKDYIESGMPVVGVCLGFQELAVYFGSKLTQNLIGHPTTSQRGVAGHKVIVLTDGKIVRNNKNEVLKSSIFEVNSHHHQGVLLNNLSKDLQPLMLAEDEEVVESFKHKSLNIAAFQHHPEEWYDSFTESVINELLEAERVESTILL